MTDTPKDHGAFPTFQHTHHWSVPIESRVTALEDAMRRNAAEWKAQRAVDEALEGYFASFSSTARHRVLAALREALK